MKIAVILLFAAFGLASAGFRHVAKDICFRKVATTHCCYKYRACGHVLTKVPFSERCDFKKCGKVCKEECKHVCKPHRVRVPKRVCHPVSRRVCHLVKGPRGRPTKVCKEVYHPYCKVRFHYVDRPKCRRVCHPVCHPVCKYVRAVCHKIRILRFQKFCPRLVCGPPRVTGHVAPPRHVVGKHGVLVRVLHVSRKIIPRPHPRY